MMSMGKPLTKVKATNTSTVRLRWCVDFVQKTRG
jgi:hypothetical protein